MSKAQIIDLQKDIKFSDNSIVSKTILDKKVGTITLFAFDAGQRLSEHTAPFDAFLQVTEGEAEIMVGGEIHNVNAGQVIIMPANVPHAVNAKMKFKMLLTMIRSA